MDEPNPIPATPAPIVIVLPAVPEPTRLHVVIASLQREVTDFHSTVVVILGVIFTGAGNLDTFLKMLNVTMPLFWTGWEKNSAAFGSLLMLIGFVWKAGQKKQDLAPDKVAAVDEAAPAISTLAQQHAELVAKVNALETAMQSQNEK